MTEKTYKEKLAGLREKLRQHGIDAYLVPRADEWQGEYVPARAARLAWLTGFTGSAGVAVIAAAKAAVYSDSRYTLQMQTQIDDKLYEAQTSGEANTLSGWLAANLAAGSKVGYDPRLHTVREIEALTKKLAAKNITLAAVGGNLVDAIWDGQPAHPDDKVSVQDEKYTGQGAIEKREAVAGDVRKAGAKAVLLTAPDSIMWLLNVRGSDVPNTPFALSYAMVHDDGAVDWFIPADKITAAVRQHIGNHVRICAFDDMPQVLAASLRGAKVMIDPGTASVALRDIVLAAGAEILPADDPVIIRKACKNETERAAIAGAHVQDGVALVRFWKWVDENAPKGELNEFEIGEKLHAFRRERPEFVGNSFDAIVGWAENGAIVHYRAEKETAKTVSGDGLLLVDSGGQYRGGTTDNTRTRAIGTPSAEMREMFTRVLKGHIAVASARFGEGTTGRDIDMLARQFLRKAGLDYGHGTGHGVGAFLSVHEAGAGISKRFEKPLKAGMFISNEPGYYKAGAFGIRIENLLFVEETGDADLKYKFNTVSLTPIDLRLVDAALLDADEIKWLNDYHRQVFDRLSPHLDAAEKEWLKRETRPLSPHL